MEPMECEDKLTYKSMLMEIIDVTFMNISYRFMMYHDLNFCTFITPEISQTTSAISPWKH